MNIKEAKQEIMDAVEAYRAKDETGEYLIPVEKQRPILLMGPPGIGKTAIMEQIATELGIGLVSYTITHHTRQSAIGLPFISKKKYGDKEYSVTEYTMSEIIASVYDEIEKTGVGEGILFLDEINCVSETLSPTMLQFLQYKTFGTHRVPDGFLIVTAGNPPEYNKSVREFDIVTLDRVKRIDIEENFEVWKEYALAQGVHGSILAYLEIKKQNFYSMKTGIDGTRYVTARGWEDLSRVLIVYEKLGKPVSKRLVIQYIEDPEIAEDFAAYYELYNKYRTVYRIHDILEGNYKKGDTSLVTSPFDEKLSLIGLLVEKLNQEFRQYAEDLEVQKKLTLPLKAILKLLKTADEGGQAAAIRSVREKWNDKLARDIDSGLMGRDEIRTAKLVGLALVELETKSEDAGAESVKSWFDSRETGRRKDIEETGEHLTNAFSFLSGTFGEGQELVIFLTELTAGKWSLKFVSECGNEAYYKYNRLLLLKDRRRTLREEIRLMLDE